MTTAPLRAVKAQSIHHFRSFDVVMAAFVAILLLSNVIGAAKVAIVNKKKKIFAGTGQR